MALSGLNGSESSQSGRPLRGNHITTAGWQRTERAGLLVPAERQYSQSEGARIPERQARSLRRRSGRGLLQQRRQMRPASVERLAPQVAAVELDQFGSLSLVVRVEPPIVRVGQGLLRLAAIVPQAASASGPATQSSELSYLYFERVAAAAPATAFARSSCPFGAWSILSLPLRPVRLSKPQICATNRSWRGRKRAVTTFARGSNGGLIVLPRAG